MCENSRQEPAGCRFIYGDPGQSDWHYCQRTIVKGGELGNAAHPPYCAHHTKVCVMPAKPFSYYGGWEPYVKHISNPLGRVRYSIDVLFAAQERGVFLND